MLKTLLILAVAYGLRAVLSPPRASVFPRRRWSWGNFLLYIFAALGILAGAGLVFLIFISSSVLKPQTFPSLASNLSSSLPPSQVAGPVEASTSAPPSPSQVIGPGRRPAYVFLHPGGPGLKNPPEEAVTVQGKSRKRGAGLNPSFNTPARGG